MAVFGLQYPFGTKLGVHFCYLRAGNVDGRGHVLLGEGHFVRAG